ncbi:MAG: dephospho-CoA kinase [Acidimicrobiaceae bacterium]|nr:dephospho-CoA kinase [Acidimicrobiaceae bacterium]HAQ23985.1 dephospho-CoA kinase [Acidimicrobiaceae bacterium]
MGLCGGIGAGKSTVAALLAGHGAVVIDVDALGRWVLTEPDILAAVVGEFGSEILTEDGSIDRPALASQVFACEGRLADLEAISHPAINQAIGKQIDDLESGANPPDLVVLDMAVLVESDLGRLDDGRGYTVVVVVEADREVRLQRLAQRGMGRTDAESRMASQATDAERLAAADHVLVNNGDPTTLSAAVDDLFPLLVGQGADSPTT